MFSRLPFRLNPVEATLLPAQRHTPWHTPHNWSGQTHMASLHHDTAQLGTIMRAFDSTLGFPGEGPQQIPIRLVEHIPPPNSTKPLYGYFANYTGWPDKTADHILNGGFHYDFQGGAEHHKRAIPTKQL